MNTRFRFESAGTAEKVARVLPCACKWSILKDCTSDAYLEVPETYEDYVERLLVGLGLERERGRIVER